MTNKTRTAFIACTVLLGALGLYALRDSHIDAPPLHAAKPRDASQISRQPSPDTRADTRATTPASAPPNAPTAATPAPALPSCNPPAGGEGSPDIHALDYSPIATMRATNKTPQEIFRDEPRDSEFAPRMENLLRSRFEARMRARLGAAPHIDAICHTSSCELVMSDFPEKMDPDRFLQALDLNTFVDAMQLGPAVGVRGSSMVLLFSASQRAPDDIAEIMNSHAVHD